MSEIAIDTDDSTDDISSYQHSDEDEDEDQDYSMRIKTRKSSSKHRQTAESKEAPDNLNEWIENNKTQQGFVIRRMIEDSFKGIKLYVVPLRSSKNNVETHYLSFNGWKEPEITGDRIVKFVKDIVQFKENLIWDHNWEISIRKIKYNYNTSQYYHENSTMMKKVANGEIFRWITDYDLMYQSIYIMITHPHKDKKKLLKEIEINDQKRKHNKDSHRYKKRKGRSATDRSDSTHINKVEWLRQFSSYLITKEKAGNAEEVKSVKFWMSKHGNQVWALTQPGVFDTIFSHDKAYENILQRLKQPQQNTQKGKINRSNSRINKKDLSILKQEDKLILLISSSESDEDNNSINVKIDPIKRKIKTQSTNTFMRSPPKRSNTISNRFIQPPPQQQTTIRRMPMKSLRQSTNTNKERRITFKQQTSLTLEEVARLSPGDALDYRDAYGRFILCNILAKQGTVVKLRFDQDYFDESFDTVVDYAKNINDFARVGAISRRISRRCNVRKGQIVSINPLRKQPGWKRGEIRGIDNKSSQVQIRFMISQSNQPYLYWTHVDYEAEFDYKPYQNPASNVNNRRNGQRIIQLLKNFEDEIEQQRKTIDDLKYLIETVKKNQTIFYYLLTEILKSNTNPVELLRYLDSSFYSIVIDAQLIPVASPPEPMIENTNNMNMSLQNDQQNEINIQMKVDGNEQQWICKSTKCIVNGGCINLFSNKHCISCGNINPFHVVDITNVATPLIKNDFQPKVEQQKPVLEEDSDGDTQVLVDDENYDHQYTIQPISSMNSFNNNKIRISNIAVKNISDLI
eukprot:446260_1